MCLYISSSGKCEEGIFLVGSRHRVTSNVLVGPRVYTVACSLPPINRPFEGSFPSREVRLIFLFFASVTHHREHLGKEGREALPCEGKGPAR